VSGQTPYAISAVVTGLARLTYEFSELIGIAYKLLPQTFLLMQRNNREIVKVKGTRQFYFLYPLTIL